MNSFVGKICPYCKGTFTEDDDIVECSDCEMPHHKDCWISNKVSDGTLWEVQTAL